MTTSFSLPHWVDLHTHLRQDALLAPVIASQLAMGCRGVLAMPNTKPPVGKIRKNDDLPYWSIEEYRAMIGDAFEILITPLYITRDTTPAMIEEGTKAGLLQACKYYPPHGTTNSDFGVPLTDLLQGDVFKAMQDNDIVLCVHGEEHAMKGEDYFARQSNAEEYFYRERMPRVIDAFPELKIVCEHITTKVAADFVLQAGSRVNASVTPQHLLYTIGHLLQGLKYHLFCLPVVKFDEDRDALRKAVTSANSTQFFAGTDSAPHAKKVTECGCAAGCFTGGVAPQLYAQAFEETGLDLSTKEAQTIFENFLCHIGPRFYGLPETDKKFTLTKTPQQLVKTDTPYGSLIPLPLGLGQDEIPWSLSL